jgi:hypothetical protein
MKAILVIDMPSNCLDCPCEYDYMRCKATNYKLDYVNADTERQSWCPLKPLPHKLQADWYTNGYKEGFNACLDEITGETECIIQKKDTSM